MAPYFEYIKPFEIDCRIGHEIGLHWSKIDKTAQSTEWRGNLGAYIKLDIQNTSSTSGLIENLALILYRDSNPSDKYLLEFIGFRVLDSSKTFYSDTEEELPLLLKQRERIFKIGKFIYKRDKQFPKNKGIYIAELLIFLERDKKATLVRTLEIEFLKDIVDTYAELREKRSSSLVWIPEVGNVPIRSRKLSDKEYQLLK